MSNSFYHSNHDVKTGIKTGLDFVAEVSRKYTINVSNTPDGTEVATKRFVYRTFAEHYGYGSNDVGFQPWMNGVWCSMYDGTKHLGYGLIAVHWEDLIKAKNFVLQMDIAKLESDLAWVSYCAEEDYGTPKVERSQLPNPKV